MVWTLLSFEIFEKCNWLKVFLTFTMPQANKLALWYLLKLDYKTDFQCLFNKKINKKVAYTIFSGTLWTCIWVTIRRTIEDINYQLDKQEYLIYTIPFIHTHKSNSKKVSDLKYGNIPKESYLNYLKFSNY